MHWSDSDVCAEADRRRHRAFHRRAVQSLAVSRSLSRGLQRGVCHSGCQETGTRCCRHHVLIGRFRTRRGAVIVKALGMYRRPPTDGVGVPVVRRPSTVVTIWIPPGTLDWNRCSIIYTGAVGHGDSLQAIDRGDIGLQLILLDLVAVIDTVDHAISLRVQTTFGIDDSAHWWFQSYLSGRHHYVRHGSARSTIVTSILQCASGFCAGTSSVRLVHRGADTERHVAASVRWRHSRYTYGSYRCLLLWMHFHRRSITECVDAV